MAKVPYLLYRNEKAGTPSVYCRVQHHQTLTFDDLCRSAAANLHMQPGLLKAYVQEALDEARRMVMQGHRVEIGDRFLSLYAQVRHAVPAEVDPETGAVRWPDLEDIVPTGDDGRLECEVHKRANQIFRSEVHWERARHDYRKKRNKK